MRSPDAHLRRWSRKMNSTWRSVFLSGIVPESAGSLFFATTHLIQAELFGHTIHLTSHSLAYTLRNRICPFCPPRAITPEGEPRQRRFSLKNHCRSRKLTAPRHRRCSVRILQTIIHRESGSDILVVR